MTNRRQFLHRAIRGGAIVLGAGSVGLISGCAGRGYGHLLASEDKDMVGSHAAGAAVWNSLVDESVAKVLGRSHQQLTMAGPAVFDASGQAVSVRYDASGAPVAVHPADSRSRVCFVGVENKSAEELGDFKDQLYEQIDSRINSADHFQSISRRMIDAALVETRLRPDSLFLPHHRDQFAAALGRAGAPVDHLLFATVTTGTTDRNQSSQRDYLLTLEMVNVHSGDFVKESAKIRKGYSKTRAGKWWNYGIFDQADG